MGKSPGKWIRGVLFGKKSKDHISKGREKLANEREVVVAAKTSGADFASVSPTSQPLPITTEGNEGKLGLENKEAENIYGDGGTVFPGSENAETQGSIPQDVPSDPEQIRKEQAATIVQATFRGYLARRAFWALKGIIRLQALIRGHLVRRQAVATLCSMLGIVKFQALIRGRRIRTSDIGLEVQSKCNLAMPMVGKLDPVSVNISTQITKLSINAFIRKLLAPSPTVMPLHVHYESGDPNSVPSWLERWSSTHFWKPVPQPKRVLDTKSQKKQGNGQIAEPQASRSKRTRRSHSTNVESVSMQATSELEKPKRSFRKVSSHPAEPVQENPQIELEKVKRNLRKVHNPVVENSAQSEVGIENPPKQSLENEFSSSTHDGVEQYINNGSEKVKKEPMSNDKVKKEATSIEKVKKETAPSEKVKKETTPVEKVKKETTSILPEVEAVPEPIVTKEVPELSSGDRTIADDKPPVESTSKEEIVPDEQATVESQVLTENTKKEENVVAANGGLGQKEDLTSIDNQKSGRKASTPAKQERAENGVQTAPALPSYMAATESAKAKLKVQGSPRFGQDETEKNNLNRRHSLPSSTNSKISSQSPRTQRLVQTCGKGGKKSDKSLSSRDGNGKVTQAEWRR